MLFERLNHELERETDGTLTIILVALCLFGVAVAIWAPPVAKAGLIAYWVLP